MYLYDFLYPHLNAEHKDCGDEESISVDISSDDGENKMHITVEDSNGNIIAKYCDDGQTMRFMKGLGKLSTAAYISSYLKNGQEFFFIDKHGNRCGLARIKVLEENYIVIGGQGCDTTFTLIDGKNVKEITSTITWKLVKMFSGSHWIDFKSMQIMIKNDVAIIIGSAIFEKPYVNVLK